MRDRAATLWHSVAVTDDGEWSGEWSHATTITRRNTARDDVGHAHRGVASFSGGGPAVGDSVREFVRRYGWRAYALPVLVIVTVVALLTVPHPARRQGRRGRRRQRPRRGDAVLVEIHTARGAG